MICLRCGTCCIGHAVVIVVDPEIGPTSESNLAFKDSGERCRHLRGAAPPFSCALHDEPWYPETPCARHGQIERHEDELCRLGNYHLNGRTAPGERLCPSSPSAPTRTPR